MAAQLAWPFWGDPGTKKQLANIDNLPSLSGTILLLGCPRSANKAQSTPTGQEDNNYKDFSSYLRGTVTLHHSSDS
jgi:hypothetical protein